MEIDLVNEQYSINLPLGSHVTLSGLITDNIGRVPKPNEILTIENFRIKILRATKTKIELVQLIVQPVEPEI